MIPDTLGHLNAFLEVEVPTKWYCMLLASFAHIITLFSLFFNDQGHLEIVERIFLYFVAHAPVFLSNLMHGSDLKK